MTNTLSRIKEAGLLNKPHELYARKQMLSFPAENRNPEVMDDGVANRETKDANEKRRKPKG